MPKITASLKHPKTITLPTWLPSDESLAEMLESCRTIESEIANGNMEGVPGEMDPVIDQLQAEINYRNNVTFSLK